MNKKKLLGFLAGISLGILGLRAMESSSSRIGSDSDESVRAPYTHEQLIKEARTLSPKAKETFFGYKKRKGLKKLARGSALDQEAVKTWVNNVRSDHLLKTLKAVLMDEGYTLKDIEFILQASSGHINLDGTAFPHGDNIVANQVRARLNTNDPAEKARRKDIVGLLLTYGANPEYENLSNETAIKLAQEAGDEDMLAVFWARGWE